ncbi:MAG: RHS repeat-associated core domain-containing protein, partial [Actinomycetota bacterium]
MWTYTYDDRGRPTAESTGTTATTSKLDGLGRVLRKAVTGGASSTIDYTYDNPGDSPASQIDITGPLPVESTFITDAGRLLGTRTAAGTDYHYYSGHGDLAQTLVGPTALPLHAQALSFDEFGNRQVTTAMPPAYGWTGQQQRATNVATSVIRMGVRLYDPTLGRFLSKDPVAGGSANDLGMSTGSGPSVMRRIPAPSSNRQQRGLPILMVPRLLFRPRRLCEALSVSFVSRDLHAPLRPVLPLFVLLTPPVSGHAPRLVHIQHQDYEQHHRAANGVD